MTELHHRVGSGGAKDNVRDELAEAAGQGRGGRTARKEAAPEEEEQAGSGGSRTLSGTSWPSRKRVASRK